MKKLKNTLIPLFLITCLMFSGIAIVNSGGGYNAGGDSGGAGNSCSDCTCTYAGDSTAYHIWGMRISAIDYDNANRISGTVSLDLFSSASPSTSLHYEDIVYVVDGESGSNKYTKMEFYNQYYGADGREAEVNIPLTSTTLSALNITAASEVGFDSSFNITTTAAMQSSQYQADVARIYEKIAEETTKYKETNNPADLAFTNELFAAIGLKGLDEMSEEEINNTYLLIEPLVGFTVRHSKMNSSRYTILYGTITEIAGALYGTSQCKSVKTLEDGSTKTSYWEMSIAIIQRTGIMLYGTPTCQTSDGNMDRCTPKGWPGVSTMSCGGSWSAAYQCTKALLTKNSYGVGYVWLGAFGITKPGCEPIVGYLNEEKRQGTISQADYDAYIEKIRTGEKVTITATDGSVYTSDSKNDYYFMKKANYDKYNDGYAACADRETVSQDCDAAIRYINQNFTRGTLDYHNAVAQVRAGTFEYEDIDGTLIKIDKGYSYFYLTQSNYVNYNGGIAACEDEPDECGVYNGFTADIDDCQTGATYFSDIEDEDAWLTCEIAYTKGSTKYSSDNTGHDAVESTNGGIVGNTEYCELFCYENVRTSFPTSVYGVKAGQTFTWGTADGTFGTIRVEKKCSTQNYVYGQQGYRFEEWEEDYKDNEEALIKYYMRKASYEKEKNTITTSSSGRYTACCGCCYTVTRTRSDGSTYTYTRCPNNCEYRYKGTARSSSESHSYSHSYVGGVTGTVSGQYYSTGYSYMTASAAEAAAKSGLEAKLDNLANSEYAKYTGKITSEKVLLEKIRQCTNNLEYLYKTTVQFTFKEPINSVYGANSRGFSFDDNLVLSGNYNTNNVNKSQCIEKTAYSYTCSGTGSSATCTPTVQKVLDCTMVTWDITGNYTYKYPTEKFQWYTLKTNSTLVNKDKKGSEDEAFFYSVGFGLPTALSLTDGTYELKVTVSNLGDNADMDGAQQYNKPDGHFAPIANTVTTKTGTGYGFEYECVYQVENDIFGYDCQYDSNGKLIYSSPEYCDNEEDEDSNGSLIGIDITYRLITLLSDGDSIDKAFPGIDGSGRGRGENWNLPESSLRDILDVDVYNTDQAMYEIMLDVNAIQHIREDNQAYFNAGKDPYTSYVDASNAQKVYCATGSGQQKYCASDFISELYNGSGLNYRLLGTCLPTDNTLERAEYILENGCDTYYTYPTINWTR